MDSPYPELKKTHTLARQGRPWRDVKPPPAAPVWAIIQGFGSYWTLVAAIDLGIFDAVQSSGRCTAPQLAARLEVAPLHLAHVLDALVTFGFLDQRDDEYELTDTAARYLCSDGAASMAALVRVAPGPHANWTRLAETVRTGEVATPIEDDPQSFYAPLVDATFATQHRAATRLGHRLAWARRPGLRVLDLGAGRAPYAIALLQQSPGSTAVVNDLAGVVGLAEQTAHDFGVADRMEFRPGDFHSIEVEADAFDVVVLGHVCRAEGDERAQALVHRARQALRPEGQLLLADYFADEHRTARPFGVQMGLTMLASTRHGRMLTNPQVSGWLSDAGFENIRLIEPIGFTDVYVATAPRAAAPPSPTQGARS